MCYNNLRFLFIETYIIEIIHTVNGYNLVDSFLSSNQNSQDYCCRYLISQIRNICCYSLCEVSLQPDSQLMEIKPLSNFYSFTVCTHDFSTQCTEEGKNDKDKFGNTLHFYHMESLHV